MPGHLPGQRLGHKVLESGKRQIEQLRQLNEAEDAEEAGQTTSAACATELHFVGVS